MSNSYKIIGADRREYGPVSAEQIRQWITEGRVDSETQLQAEGSGEWTRLVDVPELASALPELASAPITCPTCGESFEEGFDTCWKCGTGRDGSRPNRPLRSGRTPQRQRRHPSTPAQNAVVPG